MAANQNESRSGPPQDHYGQTGVSYPTPAIADNVIVEDIPIGTAGYASLPYGTPHPRVVAALLVFQGPVKGNGVEKAVRRIYANPRAVQNAYNYAVSHSGESKSCPIFTREYVVRRDSYLRTRPAKGSAFTGIYNLEVTAAGTGYTSAPTVVFTGSHTVAATATAILDGAGGIAFIALTAEGGGFAAAPTISFTGGGGSGATATATMQAAGCVLVAEESARMTGDPLDGLFVKVTRTYETLPGPWLTDSDVDEKTQQRYTVWHRKVLLSTTQPPDTVCTTYTRKAIDANTAVETYTNWLPGTEGITDPTALAAAVAAGLALMAYSETRLETVAFPTLFLEWVMISSQQSHFTRPGFSDLVPCRIDTTFSTAKVVFTGGDAPFNTREAQWHIDLFNGSGLTDAEIYNFNDGNVLYTVKLPNSIPSRAAYLALAGLTLTPGGLTEVDPGPPAVYAYVGPTVAVTGAGTEQLIGGNSDVWRAGIYKTERIYAFMR